MFDINSIGAWGRTLTGMSLLKTDLKFIVLLFQYQAYNSRYIMI